MITKRFNTQIDRRVKRITWGVAVLVVGGVVFLTFASSGSFLSAWFVVVMLAMLMLVGLSIPRYVALTHTAVEVHCVVELRSIPFDNIKEVRRIPIADMKWCVPVPLAGMWGVFGYYGYYFNLRTMRTMRLYASHWGDFVRIEDIYEEVIIVSIPDSNRFFAEMGIEMSDNFADDDPILHADPTPPRVKKPHVVRRAAGSLRRRFNN